MRRPEVFGDSGGSAAAVRRFWRRVLAHVTPAELAGMGPVVDAGVADGAYAVENLGGGITFLRFARVASGPRTGWGARSSVRVGRIGG